MCPRHVTLNKSCIVYSAVLKEFEFAKGQAQIYSMINVFKNK